jgi:hypothetical protein
MWGRLERKVVGRAKLAGVAPSAASAAGSAGGFTLTSRAHNFSFTFMVGTPKWVRSSRDMQYSVRVGEVPDMKLLTSSNLLGLLRSMEANMLERLQPLAGAEAGPVIITKGGYELPLGSTLQQQPPCLFVRDLVTGTVRKAGDMEEQHAANCVLVGGMAKPVSTMDATDWQLLKTGRGSSSTASNVLEVAVADPTSAALILAGSAHHGVAGTLKGYKLAAGAGAALKGGLLIKKSVGTYSVLATLSQPQLPVAEVKRLWTLTHAGQADAAAADQARAVLFKAQQAMTAALTQQEQPEGSADAGPAAAAGGRSPNPLSMRDLLTGSMFQTAAMEVEQQQEPRGAPPAAGMAAAAGADEQGAAGTSGEGGEAEEGHASAPAKASSSKQRAADQAMLDEMMEGVMPFHHVPQQQQQKQSKQLPRRGSAPGAYGNQPPSKRTKQQPDVAHTGLSDGMARLGGAAQVSQQPMSMGASLGIAVWPLKTGDTELNVPLPCPVSSTECTPICIIHEMPETTTKALQLRVEQAGTGMVAAAGYPACAVRNASHHLDRVALDAMDTHRTGANPWWGLCRSPCTLTDAGPGPVTGPRGVRVKCPHLRMIPRRGAPTTVTSACRAGCSTCINDVLAVTIRPLIHDIGQAMHIDHMRLHVSACCWQRASKQVPGPYAGRPYAGWLPYVWASGYSCLNRSKQSEPYVAQHQPICVQNPHAIQHAATSACTSTQLRVSIDSAQCTPHHHHHSTHPAWAVTRKQQDSGSITKGCRKQGHKYRFARIQSLAETKPVDVAAFLHIMCMAYVLAAHCVSSCNRPPGLQPTAHTRCTRLHGLQPATCSMPDMPLC